jgi:hypothetical protein
VRGGGKEAVMYGKNDDTLRGTDTNVQNGDQKTKCRVFDWTIGNECQYIVDESAPSIKKRHFGSVRARDMVAPATLKLSPPQIREEKNEKWYTWMTGTLSGIH